MAAFNPNFLLLIFLTSIFLSLTFATKDDVVSAQTPEVSTISSAPVASPASAPSSSSSSSESTVATEVDGLPETTVTEPIPNGPMSVEKQAKVAKVVGTTIIKVKEGADKFAKDVITKKLDDPKTDAETRKCLTQCKNDYKSTDGDLSKVIKDLNAGDYYNATVSVETVSTMVDSCLDCLKELGGEDVEFKKFNGWVKEVTADCVEQLSKINS